LDVWVGFAGGHCRSDVRSEEQSAAGRVCCQRCFWTGEVSWAEEAGPLALLRT
jgi:hypothetical protein